MNLFKNRKVKHENLELLYNWLAPDIGCSGLSEKLKT